MDQLRQTATLSRLDQHRDTKRQRQAVAVSSSSSSSSSSPSSSGCALRGQRPSMNLTLRSLAALVSLLLLAVALVECQAEEQLTVENRQIKESTPQAASENELADTLKYLEKLEKLDQYWSEVARPRFGRSEYKQRARTDLWAASRPLRPARNSALGNSPLLELISARLAQRYNSNESL